MRGLGLILYGVEGIGKTGLALQFPKPLKCISVREDGFLDLQDAGEIPDDCENVVLGQGDTSNDFLNELRDGKNYATVVVDSLSGVGQLIKDHILATVYREEDKPLQAFGSWGSQGWRIHGPIQMEKVETEAIKLRNLGTNVIFIGHDKRENVKSPTGQDYQATYLNLESAPRDVIVKWAQAVLFLSMEYSTKVTKKWKDKVTEAKVTDPLDESVTRVIYTTKHPAHSAKNRLKLPPTIDMGNSAEEAYNNLVEELPPNFQEFLKEEWQPN